MSSVRPGLPRRYDFSFKGTRSAPKVSAADVDLSGYHTETWHSAEEFLKRLPHDSINSELVGLAHSLTWPINVYVPDGPKP